MVLRDWLTSRVGFGLYSNLLYVFVRGCLMFTTCFDNGKIRTLINFFYMLHDTDDEYNVAVQNASKPEAPLQPRPIEMGSGK